MDYIQLVPDWRAYEKVVLALPNQIEDNGYREDIIVDYAGFLKKKKVNVGVLYNEHNGTNTISKLQELRVELHNLEASDIWIRDWAPLLATKGEQQIGLKFQYANEYAYNPSLDNDAGRRLCGVFGLDQREFGLVWDMGNFTTNGKGSIIVTDQVLQHNGMVRAADLKDYLIHTVGCAPSIQVFAIHVTDLYKEIWDLILGRPDEAICHIDGIMRFISADELVYSDIRVNNRLTSKALSYFPLNWDPHRVHRYRSVYQEITARITQLSQQLQQQQIATRCYPIAEHLSRPDEITCGETISDSGDYINFLRVEDTLFLPKYSSMGRPSKAKYNFIQTFYLEDVEPGNKFVDRLCVLGGVLNCASWVLYKTTNNNDLHGR